MMLGVHPLGCSVKALHDMGNSRFNGVSWDSGSDVYTKSGLNYLLDVLKENKNGLNRGALCVWADTSDNDRYLGVDESSGKRFYEYLKKLGHHVEKSRSYKNPEHDGMCTLYMWYFRRRPTPTATRSTTTAGGKKVVSKAKTTNRISSSR